MGAFEAGGTNVLSLRLQADTSPIRDNGYVKVKQQFATAPPADVFSTSSGVVLRVSDALNLAVSCSWAAGDCVALPRGRIRCRTADSKAQVTFAPSRSTPNAYVAIASCKGFGFNGPFQVPFAVTLTQGTDVQREGAISSCLGLGSGTARCLL